MNLRQACSFGTEQLTQACVSDASIDARYLLEWAADITLTDYLMHPDQLLTDEQEHKYLEAIEKRRSRIPLQHITGEQEFMGLTFRVTPDVLVPRQDTELLVEEGLKRLTPEMRVLDLCTGSGCIIISLDRTGRERGCVDDRTVLHGSDISEAALAVAKENAERLGAKVSFYHSDVFQELSGKYDMIVSNPPYIATDVILGLEEEVRCHDPFLALDGKEDGLYFYKKIICEAREHLNKGGSLMFEIGHDQREAVASLMKENGYSEIQCCKDLAGLDRVVIGMYDV